MSEQLHTLRPEILAFAHMMEAKLRENDHKPGWKSDAPLALHKRLEEESNELRCALVYPKGNIGAEAADVANFAMMIADVSGVLPTYVEGAV